MKVFEIYTDDKLQGFRETLEDAKQAAVPWIEQGYLVRIKHPCKPVETAKWRHDVEVSAWVRSN